MLDNIDQKQLENDPSLRWCPYRKWEMVWSDELNTNVRFVEYVGDRVRLADVNSCGNLPGLFSKLAIRRPS